MRLIIPILIFLLFPGLALARPPQFNRFGDTDGSSMSPRQHQIQATAAISIPYDFTPVEADPDPPGKIPLPINTNTFYGVDFINNLVGIALGTVNLALGSTEFAILVIFMAAFLCLMFLFYLVAQLRTANAYPKYDNPDTIDPAAELRDDQGRLPINYYDNPDAEQPQPQQPSRARQFANFFRGQANGFRRSYRNQSRPSSPGRIDIYRPGRGGRGRNPFK